MTTGRECKDCRAEIAVRPGQKSPVKLRPAPHPGPRCATHHRVEALRRKKAAQARRRESVYGLTNVDHDALLVLQGGACAICQKARGVRRALAVDHDHELARQHDHDEDKGCRECVRGLLCKRCNRLLGEFRDDPETFERAAAYLRYPPMADVRASRTGSARSAAASAGSASARAGSTASAAEATASSDPRT
jgi:hypothetical protein